MGQFDRDYEQSRLDTTRLAAEQWYHTEALPALARAASNPTEHAPTKELSSPEGPTALSAPKPGEQPIGNVLPNALASLEANDPQGGQLQTGALIGAVVDQLGGLLPGPEGGPKGKVVGGLLQRLKALLTGGSKESVEITAPGASQVTKTGILGEATPVAGGPGTEGLVSHPIQGGGELRINPETGHIPWMGPTAGPEAKPLQVGAEQMKLLGPELADKYPNLHSVKFERNTPTGTKYREIDLDQFRLQKATDVNALKAAFRERLTEQKVGEVAGQTVTERPRTLVASELAGKQLAGSDVPVEHLKAAMPNSPLSDEHLMAFGQVVGPEINKAVLMARNYEAVSDEEVAKQFFALKESVAPYMGANTASARGLAITTAAQEPVEQTARSVAEIAMDPDVRDLPTLRARLAALDTVNEKASTLLQDAKPTMSGKLKYLMINGMLGMLSNGANLIGTGLNLGFSVPIKTASILAGKTANRLAPGMEAIAPYLGNRLEPWMVQKAKNFGLPGAQWGEDGVLLSNMIISIGNGLKLGAHAFRQDAPIFGQVRQDLVPNYRKVFGIEKPNSLLEHAHDYMAWAFGTTGRLMMSVDESLKTLAANGSAGTSVWRDAMNNFRQQGNMTAKGLHDAFLDGMHTKYWNMPEAEMSTAKTDAMYWTMNSELGDFGQRVMGLREGINKLTGGIGGTFIQPFMKTLINGMKMQGENSPLAVLSKNVRADIGGADPIKRDAALGKWAFGTAFGMMMTTLAYQGRLQGVLPDDPHLSEAYREDGYAEGTLQHPNGTMVQLGRLTPWGNLAMAYGSVGRAWHLMSDGQRAEAAMTLVHGTFAALDANFMASTAGMWTFLTGAGKKQDVDEFVKGFARMPGSMIPGSSIIRTVENLKDPYQRKPFAGPRDEQERQEGIESRVWGKTPIGDEVNKNIDRVLAGLPGYNTLAKKYGLREVYAERNVYGEKVERPRALWGTEWFNPMYISRSAHDPFIEKLIETGVGVQPPPKVMTLGQGANALKIPLTAKEYDRYQEDVGKLIKQRAPELLASIPAGTPLLVQKNVITEFLHQTWKEGMARAVADVQGYPGLSQQPEKAGAARGAALQVGIGE